MTFSREQIEAVTASVLRELASRGVAVAASSSLVTTKIVSPVAGPGNGDNGSVALSEKVISEETLAAAKAIGKNVEIPAGAIITPSGHDYIRRNRITVTSLLATGKTSAEGMLIVVGQSATAASAAKTAKWSVIAAGCERDAAKKVRQQLSKPVICCGGEPAVTACLLNRDGDLRVAVVTQNTDVRRLGKLMNPQVICLDAAGWSSAQLLKLLRAMPFGAGQPASWKELAGGDQ